MWTEREKILNNYDEIIKYIDSIDNFHDYRIGHINYDGKNAEITIEDTTTGLESKYYSHLIWNFIFENVTLFEICTDCVVEFGIFEVVKGENNNSINFGLNNGHFNIEAESISLGIPSQDINKI